MKKIIVVFCLAIFLAGCGIIDFRKSDNEIIVSPNGTAGNNGTLRSPMSFEAAIAHASQILKLGKIKSGDNLKITLKEGLYYFTKTIELGKEFAGTDENPIVIQAVPGAKVIFDGRVNVTNPESFEKVSLEEELKRLPESSRENVVVKTISNPELIEMFKSKILINLGIDDKAYLPAVYPNDGFALLDTEPIVHESFPPGIPKNEQDYGKRAGHLQYREMKYPAGWLGSLDDPRGAKSGISGRSDEMAGSWDQWEFELKRDNKRNSFTGFYEAIWKLSTMQMHAVNAEEKTIHLPKAFSYGFGWLKEQPFRVYGLICELDQPGEWYFDTKSNRLYIYPVKPFTEDTKIGLPIADGFLKLSNCAHVKITGINVRNVGEGIIFNVDGGSNNLIAGCSMRNSTAEGANITGTHNGMLSCDFVDLNYHLTLGGGRRNSQEIVSGHNFVENSHFYHKNFTHKKILILMNGVGNTFKNNLIHNSIGQAMMVEGNDHIVELNEYFNIGYEEGDGGALYSGADLTGYGNLYKNNFFHHLMRTPKKKIGRNGLYIDDFQAGATVIGNVFYKSCNAGISMNNGAGNSICDF